MAQAFLRLLMITAGTLILFIMVVIALRQLGAKQSYPPPPHAWFSLSDWTLLPESLIDGDQPGIQLLSLHLAEAGWVTSDDEPLRQVLAKAKKSDWLIWVKARDQRQLDDLLVTLNEQPTTVNFGFYSDSQKVIRYLRKKAPQWVYGADPSSLLRLRVFSSFGLESIVDFWPDFVIFENLQKMKSQLSANEETEILKRNKRIVCCLNE